MRKLTTLLLSIAAIATVSVATAEAQYRRGLSVTVTKRSFLDAGKVVQVGRMHNYADFHNWSAPTGVNHTHHYGEGVLPQRGFGRPLVGGLDLNPYRR